VNPSAISEPLARLNASMTETLSKVTQALREQSETLSKAASQLGEWYHSTPLAKKRASKAALVALLSRFLSASTVHKLFSIGPVDSAYSPATRTRWSPSHGDLSLTIHAPNSPPTGSMKTQGASSA